MRGKDRQPLGEPVVRRARIGQFGDDDQPTARAQPRCRAREDPPERAGAVSTAVGATITVRYRVAK